MPQSAQPREDVVGVEEAVSVDGGKGVEEEDQIVEEDVVAGEKTKNYIHI